MDKIEKTLLALKEIANIDGEVTVRLKNNPIDEVKELAAKHNVKLYTPNGMTPFYWFCIREKYTIFVESVELEKEETWKLKENE
jgi:hypothetical protein